MFWPGARSDGLPVLARHSLAVGSESLPSWPKYEKPGEVPSVFTQCAAEAGAPTIKEDIAAKAIPKIILFFMCKITFLLL